MNVPADFPAVLLVGGKGTRLRPVLPSTPKPLAPIGDRSFLELLVRQLQCQQVRRLVMCTGFLAGEIEKQFQDGSAFGVAIEYAREQRPMGTGGAVKLIRARMEGNSSFLVMNGDSFLQMDISKLLQFHRAHAGIATIAVRWVPDASRYGTVKVDGAGRIAGFSEKGGKMEPGLINAGVYIFSPAIFDRIPQGEASLEREVFPNILDSGVYAMEHGGMFIDIGVPEDYARAQAARRELIEAACRR
jgi:NDP-sugar pyrophosphorylase family protein